MRIELNPKRTPYSTSTRRAIVDVLRTQSRYMTVAALHAVLVAERPRLALSTVYRTLELLEAQGTVSSRAEAGGESAYVFCKEEHHHHAICRECGHVEEVECDAVEELTQVLTERQFELEGHSIEFFGRCARCR